MKRGAIEGAVVDERKVVSGEGIADGLRRVDEILRHRDKRMAD